ncbi:hypothetical protein PX699_17985 [Sphingobium sp. H39-3-25]|uniref:hypothetical protein n=1 Tax=Sphingobium arseniciresistens TaxID=3030834 RepID=UPI0023B9B3E7|nr:hypothetical protein [Sphingobium arseniciresistens]
MRPTEIIREWFDAESLEVQSDIAFLTVAQLADVSSVLDSPAGTIAALRDWLTPGESEISFRTVGKALSFIAVFEDTFNDRFTAEGWQGPRNIFDDVAANPPHQAIQAAAGASLAMMSRKQAEWAAVGERWESLKVRLTHEHFERWRLGRVTM